MKKIITILVVLTMSFAFVGCFGDDGHIDITFERLSGYYGPEVIRVYTQDVPATRFIGKQYTSRDMVHGSFGAMWDLWFENGWFDVLENQTDVILADFMEDGDANVALHRYIGDANDGYWIGRFMPENTPVPEGFGYFDFPAGRVGIAWVQGSVPAVFDGASESRRAFVNQELTLVSGISFERYVPIRFQESDENDFVILDFGFFVE